MKIYADTSIFGGVFDHEFSEPSKQFFVEVDAGRYMLVTSAIVEAEIEPAPEKVRAFFSKYAKTACIAVANQEALDLQTSYIHSGVVIENSLKMLFMWQSQQCQDVILS